MSERVDAEKVETIPPIKKVEPHPTSFSPPATGEPTKPPPPPPPDPKTSGGGKYGDDYKMVRREDGVFTLTDPGGREAIWDGSWWIDPETLQPMPEGWEKDHYPEEKGLPKKEEKGSSATPQPHKSGIDKPTK